MWEDTHTESQTKGVMGEAETDGATLLCAQRTLSEERPHNTRSKL